MEEVSGTFGWLPANTLDTWQVVKWIYENAPKDATVIEVENTSNILTQLLQVLTVDPGDEATSQERQADRFGHRVPKILPSSSGLKWHRIRKCFASISPLPP